MSPRSAFDFDAAVTAPFRMQPGLRKLAASATQLTALRPAEAAFDEKLAVLCEAPTQALLCVPGFDPLPAWRALAAEAAQQCADAIQVDAEGLLAPQLGWRVRWDGSALAALDAPAHAAAGACLKALPTEHRIAGLLSLALHEDFAIVDGRHATLPALAVCLPSHWAPADKIGRSFATVHGPVADNATLLAASEHLMRLVCQPQRWERFVCNVTQHKALDQHPARHARTPWPADVDALIGSAQWRTERQTFIPLPALQQAVFTIHVAVEPLAQAIATPERAAALHAALASMSEAVLDYRGLRAAQPALLAWLAQRAAGV